MFLFKYLFGFCVKILVYRRIIIVIRWVENVIFVLLNCYIEWILWLFMLLIFMCVCNVLLYGMLCNGVYVVMFLVGM